MSTFLWLLLTFGLSAGVALLLTPATISGAGSLRLLDSPDGGRRNHAQPVPRIGGVAVYLAASVVACAVFAGAAHVFLLTGDAGDEQIRFLIGALLGSALLLLTGLVDDVRELSAGTKFVAQIAAAVIAWYFGAKLDAVALGYGQGVPVGIFALPLLLLWIVGVTNAFNFIDGLNGLAGGVALVAFATFFIAALALGNSAVLIPCAALAGALLGFLRFNFPKARIFLGDSGSMSIGFLLAVLSLRATENASGAILLAIPVLALSVPLLDTSLAILRRWLRHVPISGADARHIHHRLQALGVSPRRAAIVLWVLATTMAGFGLLIALTAPFVASSIAIVGMVAVAVLLIYGTNLLSYHELIVAGEVLLSAPSRARRVISDQILALDLTAMLGEANTVDDVATILSDAAAQFGFMGMELIGHSSSIEKMQDRILPADWAWRLDYPIRRGPDAIGSFYLLRIWCSPELGARPYGAERVARVLGPALHQWFAAQPPEGTPVGSFTGTPARGLRIGLRRGR
jgi:UDP-GlcNAc:undecaprenyl-phosphate GlcNAc-1-phosphate transferase